MSNYTQTIMSIVNSLSYNNLAKSPKERIEIALPLLFDFDYPIFDESYRRTLERKIVYRYLTNEICTESYDLWKIWLEEKMLTIMDYYNQLYASVLQYDITKNYNIVTSNAETSTTINDSHSNTTTSNDSNGTGSSTGGGNVVDSNTPHGRVAVNDKRFASFISENSSNTSSNNEEHSDGEIIATGGSTVDGTRNVTSTTSGNNVFIGDLIAKHRSNIINIDNMIIEDLEELFMGIY